MLLLYNLSVMIIVVHTILSFPFFADVSRKYGNVMANKEPFSSSYGIANKRKGQNSYIQQRRSLTSFQEVQENI